MTVPGFTAGGAARASGSLVRYGASAGMAALPESRVVMRETLIPCVGCPGGVCLPCEWRCFDDGWCGWDCASVSCGPPHVVTAFG